MATVKTILNIRVLALSLLFLFFSFEVFSFLQKNSLGTCTGSKPCGTYPFCTAKKWCPNHKKVCHKKDCEPTMPGNSLRSGRPHGSFGMSFPIWWGPCINNIQTEYTLAGLFPASCLTDPFAPELRPMGTGPGPPDYVRCTDNHGTTGRTRPCEPPCEKKKPCECGPEVCENESCPAKVDCPLGGQACSLDQCPGKTSTPGFNIGNLILGNLPKTANQSPPASTNVPLNQRGAVVKGALRVYVDSFDDFKVCGKQGQCYKVCYSDGTNCPHKKK